MTISQSGSGNPYAVGEMLGKMIRGYMDERDEKGLPRRGVRLVPAQTGSGKTHAVAKKIGEECLREKGRRCVYVVDTKHNAKEAYEKILELTPEAGEKVLLLKRDVEMVTDYFESLDDESRALRKVPEYQELKKTVEATKDIRNALAQNMETLKHVEGEVQEKIRELRKALSAEDRKWRGVIRREKNDGKRKSLEKEHRAFRKEVAELFPTADLKRYRAVVMTTHKLLKPLWTLSGHLSVYEMKNFDRGVLFIDEFDRQKEVILSDLIERASDEIVDKIRFFRNASHVLAREDFLAKYGVSDEIAAEVKSQFREIYDEYIGGYAFVHEHDDREHRYILRSATFRAIVGDQGDDRLTIFRNEKRKINVVRPKEEKDAGEPNFFEMIGKMDRAIRRLAGLGYKVISMEKQRAWEEAQKEEVQYVDLDHRMLSILRQFIGEFNLAPGSRDWNAFEGMILKRYGAGKHRSVRSLRSEFYARGFSLLKVGLTEPGTRRSDFEFFGLDDTPEALLARVSKKMMVVGISATATIPSVTANFDLEYLREVTDFREPSRDEIRKMNRLYRIGKGQDRRQFHVEFFSGDNDDPEYRAERLARELFAGDPVAERDLVGLFRGIGEEGKYIAGRYEKIFRGYWRFLTTPGLRAFLSLHNAYPKSGEVSEYEALNELTLKRMFVRMIWANKENPQMKETWRRRALSFESPGAMMESTDVSDLFFIHTSQSGSTSRYEDEILPRLKKGGEVFLISVYRALGAGRNIQYAIDGEDGSDDLIKDFDAIYCEYPTHILVRSKDRKNPLGSLIRLLYQIHVLYAAQEIGRQEFHSSLRQAMSLNEQNWRRIVPNGTTENQVHTVMGKVIQGVGRLHRENIPEHPMHLFFDDALIPVFQKFDAGRHALLPSMEKALEQARSLAETGTGENDVNMLSLFKDHTVGAAHFLLGKIEHLLGSFNDTESIREYEEIRNYLLLHPAVSGSAGIFEALYAPPLPKGKDRYWYKQQDDYERIEVRFAEGAGWIEVSPEACRLPALERLPELADLFEDGLLARSGDWRKPRPMNPIAYNNLYKGILGEIVGKTILAKAGIELSELPKTPELYEKFDFIHDSSEIYVDFKYFSPATSGETTEAELRKKAAEKLREIGGKAALIVNIFHDGSVPNPEKKIEFIDGVAVVPFLVDFSDENRPKADEQMMKKMVEILR